MLPFSQVLRSQESTHICYEATHQRLQNHLPEMIRGAYSKAALYLTARKDANFAF